MILDNLNISVIYQSTTATITNSGSDTITSVIDYDNEKLSITVNNDNTISISSLTNEKATYENIRVQGSTGDYVYITVNTLVNSQQPTYDIFDDEENVPLYNYSTQLDETLKCSRVLNTSTTTDNTIPYTINDNKYIINKVNLNIGTNATDTPTTTECKVNLGLYYNSNQTGNMNPLNLANQNLGTDFYGNITPMYKRGINIDSKYIHLIKNIDLSKLLLNVFCFYITSASDDVSSYNVTCNYLDNITFTSNTKVIGIGVVPMYNYNGTMKSLKNMGIVVSDDHNANNSYYSFANNTTYTNVTNTTITTEAPNDWIARQYLISTEGEIYHNNYFVWLFGNINIANYTRTYNISNDDIDGYIQNDYIGTYNGTRTPYFKSYEKVKNYIASFGIPFTLDGTAPSDFTNSSVYIKDQKTGTITNGTGNTTILNYFGDHTDISDNNGYTESGTDTNTYTDTTPYKHVSNGSYNNNFNKQFLLNKTELSALADTFWGNQTDIINNSKLMGETPLNSVISLRYYPFNLGSFSTETNINYYCGNYQIGSYETLNTAMDPIIDLGSIYIPKHFNNFLDYDNYTEIELFLPFCESVSLSPREYLDTTLNIKMCVDWNTGACLLYCYQNGILKFTKTGQCATDIAINGRDNATYTQQQINGCINTVNSATSGLNSATALKGGVSLGGVNDVVSGIGSTFSNAYATSHASNPPISSGTTTTTLGLYKPLYPYIIFRYSQPLDDLTNYGKVHGYACYYNTTLGTCKGFTVCDNIDINKLKCTSDEKTQILQYLTSGVIL